MLDFVTFLKKTAPEKAGYFGSEVRRNGEARFELILCTPTRVKVSSALWKDKWARKGARGSLQDAKWPREGETPQSFLRRWAAVMAKRALQFGSETHLFHAWDRYRDMERKRLKKYHQGGTRLRQRRRKRPLSDIGVSTDGLEDGFCCNLETAALVGDDAGLWDWSPHEFADFDQGLALPCRYLPVQFCSHALSCPSSLSGLVKLTFASSLATSRRISCG